MGQVRFCRQLVPNWGGQDTVSFQSLVIKGSAVGSGGDSASKTGWEGDLVIDLGNASDYHQSALSLGSQCPVLGG